MNFPRHIYAIGTTLPLHGMFLLLKHGYLIWFKWNPTATANIIKPILQMNSLKLTEVKSDTWGHRVAVWQSWNWKPTYLILGPCPFLLCHAGRRCMLQPEKRCYSYSIKRKESTDLPKVTHCVRCSETRTKYKVSGVYGPSSFPVATCLVRKDGDKSLKGNHLWQAEHVAELSTKDPAFGHQGPIEGYLSLVSCNVVPIFATRWRQRHGGKGMALASDQLQAKSSPCYLLSLRPGPNDLTFSVLRILFC